MAAGVLLDTSFLITLADKNRPHHEAARRYWRHFLETDVPIFLSTIVASEFSIKQEIPPEILRSCVVLPFNWDDALKDDIKIIAQAAQADVEFAITDDGESFYKYCQTFKDAGEVQFRAIKLADGFDRAFFDPNGQRDFTDDLGAAAEDQA